MKKYDLSIFDLLRAVDCNDASWLRRQPENAQKAFTPFTVMRWAATVDDGGEAAYMVWMVNERVNDHLFQFATKHPELVFRLMASCGLGRRLRHQWLGMPPSSPRGNAASDFLREYYPDANDDELAILMDCDKTEFTAFLDDCGLQPNDSRRNEVVNAHDRYRSQTAQNQHGKSQAGRKGAGSVAG